MQLIQYIIWLHCIEFISHTIHFMKYPVQCSVQYLGMYRLARVISRNHGKTGEKDDDDDENNDDDDDGFELYDGDRYFKQLTMMFGFSYTDYSLHNIHREMEVRRGIDSIALKVSSFLFQMTPMLFKSRYSKNQNCSKIIHSTISMLV